MWTPSITGKRIGRNFRVFTYFAQSPVTQTCLKLGVADENPSEVQNAVQRSDMFKKITLKFGMTMPDLSLMWMA